MPADGNRARVSADGRRVVEVPQAAGSRSAAPPARCGSPACTPSTFGDRLVAKFGLPVRGFRDARSAPARATSCRSRNVLIRDIVEATTAPAPQRRQGRGPVPTRTTPPAAGRPSCDRATRHPRTAAGGPGRLTELRIRGLGAIEDATLELGPGLTVVTGETGAGKTMVVTGLTLLFGGRADPGRVRADGRAGVEGRLQLPPGSAGLGSGRPRPAPSPTTTAA